MEREMKGEISREEILRHVDHTLLAQTATWNEIREILDDAMGYKRSEERRVGKEC